MKCQQIFFLSVIFFTVPFFAFAQESKEIISLSAAVFDSSSITVEAKARQALKENADLKDQNEVLKKRQEDLTSRISSLQEEFLRAEKERSSKASLPQGQKKGQVAKENIAYFTDAKKKAEKTEDGLRARLENIQKETRALQENIDRLQAQKQSLRSFSDSLAQERLREGASPTQKAIQELQEKAVAAKAQQQKYRDKIGRLQKSFDLVFSVDFKNEGEASEKKIELSSLINMDQPPLKFKESDIAWSGVKDHGAFAQKKIGFGPVLQKLQDFSVGLSSPDQAMLIQKNNELINEVKGLEAGSSADNDRKVLVQRLQALKQLKETTQAKVKELQEEFDRIAVPQKRILFELEGLIVDEKNLAPQGLERQKMFLKEQIQITKEQNERLADALERPETERQEKLLKKEQKLRDQVNELEAKNKLLSNKIADAEDNIKKGQKDKDLLEGLLKGQKGDNTDFKAVMESPSADQKVPSGKSAWKVPEILK